MAIALTFEKGTTSSHIKFSLDSQKRPFSASQKTCPCNFVFKHGVDIYRLPPIKRCFPFLFRFSKTGKKFIPHFISVSKFMRVAENNSQSQKSRPSASILVLYPKFDILYPKFDTSRHLHVSVCVFLKKASSLKKNPWRKLRNYLTSTTTGRPCVCDCCFDAPHISLAGGQGQLLPCHPGQHATVAETCLREICQITAQRFQGG